MLCSLLGAGEKGVNKTDTVPTFKELEVYTERQILNNTRE